MSVPDVYSAEKPSLVRSLYFDTPDNMDFQTKMAGTYARKKLRLRTYGRDNALFKLEAKRKRGDLQTKLSLPVTAEEARQLSRGNYFPLMRYFPDSSAETSSDVSETSLQHTGAAQDVSDTALYLYKTLMLGVYRPVVLIEYERTAYVSPVGNVRLTIDEHIRSAEGAPDLFRPDTPCLPVMNGKAVLEVKFDRVLPGWISDLLAPFHLTRVSVSKYTLGRPVYDMFE